MSVAERIGRTLLAQLKCVLGGECQICQPYMGHLIGSKPSNFSGDDFVSLTSDVTNIQMALGGNFPTLVNLLIPIECRVEWHYTEIHASSFLKGVNFQKEILCISRA